MNRLLPLLLIAAVSCSFSSFGLNGDDISSTGTCVALEPALENPPGGCATPDVPTTSNATGSSFDVAWTCGFCSGGESFIVEYGLSGFTPGTGASAGAGGTILGAATSPETLFGLDPSTSYDVYVRSDCGGTYSSNTAVVSQSTTAPPGDVCTDAIVITCGASLSGNTSLGYVNEPLAPCGTINDGAPSVWYVASGTGAGMTASLCGSSFDTKVFVFEGNCGVLNCIDGNDDFCGTQSEVSWTSNIGTDYYIIVSGSGASSGAYTLSLSCDPTNDVCADAIPITCGQTISATTVGSTAADAEVAACGTSTNGLPGIWYSFVGDGRTVTLSTCDQAAYDTKLAVYSGACGALVCVGGNDDGPGCSGFTSELDVATECGEQYYVYVTGFLGATGTFDLTMSCAGATVVTQNATVTLDGNGEFNFNTPFLPQVDVEVTSSNTVASAISSWQSFTASTDGILHEVTFGVGATAPGPFTLTVYQGEDNTGTALFSQFVAAAQPPNSTVILPLAGTLDLTGGMEYTIEVSSAASFDWLADSGNPYAGGVSSSPGSDLVFSVSLLERPMIDNGSSSAVGIASFEVSPSTITCANVGAAETVSLIAIDNDGNTASCTALVDAVDNTLPTALCATATAPSVVASGIIATVIPDNNSGTVVETLNIPDNGLIVDVDVVLDIEHTWVGDIEVTLESPLGTMVSLIDRPGTTGGGGCPGDDIVVTLDDDAANAVEDECAAGIPTINGTFSPNGQLSDFNGQNAAGTWTLTVVDHAGGDVGRLNEWGFTVTRSVPGNQQLYLDASGNLTITASDVDGGSFDACGIASMSVSPTSFTCAEIGTPQPITLSVTDVNGNSNDCNSNVDILDTIPPVAVCQAITVYLDGTGNATISASDLDGGSSDACGLGAPTASMTSFDCSALGDTPVLFTANDLYGNSDTCTAIVTTLDTVSPVITCPVFVPQCGDDALGGVATFPTPTATDNCTTTTVSQIDGTGLSSGSFFPIGTTTLTFEATDGSGNTATCSFDVVILPQPESDFIHSSACVGEAVFFTDQSTIDPLGTITSWSWDMGDGSAAIGTVDPIHSYAAVGDYTVTLTVGTADGCTDSHSTVVSVTEVPTASFTATTECNGVGTVFTNNWSIDPGYTGGVNFFWDFGDGATSTDENPVHAFPTNGTFTVTLTVTTDDGCEDVFSSPVTVNGLPTALAIASAECEGNATQFTDLSVGSGLTWFWDFGDGSTSADQHPTHTYAAAGSYTYMLTVTTADGCVASTSATAVVHAEPIVDFSFTNMCEETVVAFTNASTAGTYAWDFGDGNSSILYNVSNTYTNSGVYNVVLTVTSSEGCVASLAQPITIYDNPEFTLTATDVACYNIPTGEIQVNMSVGAPPITYSINGNPGQSTGLFTGLAEGMHTITVSDDNGCSTTDSIMVNQPADTLGVQLISTTNIDCHGTNSGAIELVGTGGTAAYTYLIGGVPQSTGLFTGLPAGSHNIQLIDFNNCPFDTTIVLTEPDTLILMTDTIGNLLCNGDSSGFLGMSAIGGVTPYSYSLNGVDFQSGDMFNGLAAGGYTVTVMDSLGCSDTVNVTVTEPGILQLSLLSSTDALCNGQATGTILVGASSGTPGYTYSIDGGTNWQGNADFPGVAAGTHTIMVMDDNGCLDSTSVSISEPSVLTMSSSSSPVLCSGEATGSISLNALGGSPGYTYSNDGGGNYQSSSDFNGLTAGSYVMVVLDTNGCTVSESVVITEPSTALSATSDVVNVGCIGDSTGSVLVLAAGGTGAYQYSIDNGVNWQNSNSFGDLLAGSYSVLVEDGNGCQTTAGFSVTEPGNAVQISNVLANSPFCAGEQSGSLTIQAFGGTPSYTYSVDGGLNFGPDAIVTGLGQGTYNVVVVDTNGCSVSQSVQLMDPASLVLNVDTVMAANCEGDFTGQIIASATGGTGTLMYSLDSGTPQSDGTFTSLESGSYILSVSDVNGCTASQYVAVPHLLSAPQADFTYIVAGETVAFTNASSDGDSYNWNFGDGESSTETDPNHIYDAAGNYNVTLTVTNDCGTDSITQLVSTVTFGINQVENIANVSIYPNPSNGQITFTAELSQPVENLSIDILDMRGRAVWTRSMNNASGTLNESMDLSHLAQGVYQLQVSGDAWRSVHRVSISR